MRLCIFRRRLFINQVHTVSEYSVAVPEYTAAAPEYSVNFPEYTVAASEYTVTFPEYTGALSK